MDRIIKSPGLHHIAVQSFDLLDSISLKNLRLVSKDCYQFINQYFDREIWIRNIAELKFYEKRLGIYLKVFVTHFHEIGSNYEWRKFIQFFGQVKNKIRIKDLSFDFLCGARCGAESL